MRNKSNWKRAFTLTELLVVVVIIGILATVILPKFTKLLETRKTTEAEEMMRAVRTEQERRCALDKNYTAVANLSDIVPNTSTNNYTYDNLTSNSGIKATKSGGNYVLQMPSYADGRICCSGTGCGQLNKDYPDCATLQSQRDFVSAPSSCTVEVTEGDDPNLPPPSPPSIECPEEDKPNPDTANCEGFLCGSQVRYYVCDETTGTWQPGAWDASNCHTCDCSYGWVPGATESEMVTCATCEEMQRLTPTQPCPSNCFPCIDNAGNLVTAYGPADVSCSFHHCEEGGRDMGPDPGGQNFNCDDHGQGGNMGYIHPVAYCTMSYVRNVSCQLISGGSGCPSP